MGSHIVINKITKFKNYIIKLTGYRFEKSSKNPLGLKYSFVLIKDNVRILGYDNHENVNIETTIDDFYEEAKKLIKSDKNGKNKN